MEDGVDSLLELENDWKEAGVDPSVLQNNAMRHGLLTFGEMLSKARSQGRAQIPSVV